MIIQCDVDGVLNDLMDVVLDQFNIQNDKKYKTDDIKSYNISDSFEKEDANKIKNIFNSSEIWDIVRPIRNAQKSIKSLIDDGHDVYFITNNNPHTFGEKFDWIKYYFPFINNDHIICMSNKWMFKCDVMIEDCYQTLIKDTNCERILFDHPWNKSTHDWVYGIYRCTNWEEIIEIINNLNME